MNPDKFDPSASLTEFKRFGRDKLAVPPEAMDRILASPFKMNMGRMLSHCQDYHVYIPP